MILDMSDEYFGEEPQDTERKVSDDVRLLLEELRKKEVTPYNYKKTYNEFIEAVRVLESIISEKLEDIDTKIRPDREAEERTLREEKSMPGDLQSVHSELAKKMHVENKALDDVKDWLILLKEISRTMDEKLKNALEVAEATSALNQFTTSAKEYWTDARYIRLFWRAQCVRYHLEPGKRRA